MKTTFLRFSEAWCAILLWQKSCVQLLQDPEKRRKARPSALPSSSSCYREYGQVAGGASLDHEAALRMEATHTENKNRRNLDCDDHGAITIISPGLPISRFLWERELLPYLSYYILSFQSPSSGLIYVIQISFVLFPSNVQLIGCRYRRSR